MGRLCTVRDVDWSGKAALVRPSEREERHHQQRFVVGRPKARPDNSLDVGAPMPGLVVRVLAAAGEEVVAGQKLFTLEAMKMETTIYAEHAGRVAEVLAQPGTQVEAGDLLLVME